MRLKTWLVAALGLGSLVMLIAVSVLTSSRKAQDIYAQLDELNGHHRRVEATLRRLRSDVNLSGIFVRDYLLDVARERAPEYRQQIAEFRRTNMEALTELEMLIGSGDTVSGLRVQLEDYWQTFDPLFDWTTTEKIQRSTTFLRREVVPRREAALRLTEEIEEINNTNLAAERQEIERRQAAFRQDLHLLLWQTVSIGLAVALVVVFRLRVLERRSGQAERQMRELSQRLVHTQEEERRSLSRELHDHVAQLLTGLRMELGRIERTTAVVAPAVSECKRLVDEMFTTVRSLALGLRPSMLDDLGLEAALEWHIRDFIARYAINVDLRMDGDLAALPDRHVTCVYRIVQEALTNCVRHAAARSIEIYVVAADDTLRVSVHDDGVGLDRQGRHRGGLGLRGIEERVRELGGTMSLSSESGKGTTIGVQLPLPPQFREAALARAAG